MKIADAFTNEKAFIAFLTCGDPCLEKTEELIVTIAENGASLIELGIPFSDPTAEGPVIENANLRALKTGVTTDKIFDMVARVQSRINIPLAFMTYANVVFSYGSERFIKKMADLGMAGLILPDVPFEEKEEFVKICRKYDIDFISLIAPTSEDRISMIAKESDGFVYCVSSLGVTGTRDNISADIDSMIAKVREATNTPTAIGFGISTPEQAKAMAAKADGVIIGSAIMKIIAKHGMDSVPHVAEYIKSIRDAI
jgi:tryptophan synthase alpha chain